MNQNDLAEEDSMDKKGADNPNASETFYSEEMSRAAVGKLFADDDKPTKSSFVSGFDRSPPKPEPKSVKSAPSSAPLVDMDFNESAESEPKPTRTPSPLVDMDFEPPPRPSRPVTPPPVDMDFDAPPQPPPSAPSHDAHRPDKNESHMKEDVTITIPRPRKEVLDNPAIQGETSDELYEAGYRVLARAWDRAVQSNPEAESSSHFKIPIKEESNPEVKNESATPVPEEPPRPRRPRPERGEAAEASAAPTERKVRERPVKINDDENQPAPPEGTEQPTAAEQPPRRRQSRAERMEQAQAKAAERQAAGEENQAAPEFDSFRQRYNPGELVSPPRNTNRPVRQGQARDVRKDRIRPPEQKKETSGYIKYLYVLASVIVLIIIIWVASLYVGARNERDDLLAQVTELESLRNQNNQLRDEYLSQGQNLINSQARVRFLEGVFTEIGIDPDDPFPAPDNGATGPVTHTIRSGESLDSIARQHFGNSYPETINHIVRTNPQITNPNVIQVGWEITIRPMEDE